MSVQRWDDVFNDRGKNPVTIELKTVLFLYLMTQYADYGWNISSLFKEAIAKGKWKDRRGLGDLKYENKVDAALKSMEQSGIVYKNSDLKKHMPSFLSSKKYEDAEITKNPRRTYYSINPQVFYDISVNTDIGDLFHEYSGNTLCIDQGLRFIQDYKKDGLKVIELLNPVSKWDFLTILTTTHRINSDVMEHYNLQQKIISQEEGDAVLNKERIRFRKKRLSTTFFNNQKKFDDLKNQYMSFLGLDEETFWLCNHEFSRLIGERLIDEVYYRR